MTSNILFKRKLYQQLLDWKNQDHGRSAVLIEGARRVGKSTLALNFAQQEYESYLLLDFSKTTKEIKALFYNYPDDLNTLFSFLQKMTGVDLPKRNSLIIFDEIQFFPQARQMIKHFVADGRYDFMETGSLISIRENVTDILSPSEETSLTLHPLDFEEFCTALNRGGIIDYIQQCFAKREPLDESMQKTAMTLFKKYLLVGGMPQSVAAFLAGENAFTAADKAKRGILSVYQKDIRKINSRYKDKVFNIFKMLPELLGRSEKRVVLNQIANYNDPQPYYDPFFWLEDSMIVNECFLCTDPQIGFDFYKKSTAVKCYMGDTGLLATYAMARNTVALDELYNGILNGRLGINQGMLYENMIAQMLAANGHPLFYYAHYDPIKKRSDIEVDFLLTMPDGLKLKISPIEVKSSKNYTTKSLDRFREKFKKRVGECFIIHPRNLQQKNGVWCIPPYMTICL